MQVFPDLFGRNVRLTDERRRHFLEHPEMTGLDSELGQVLSNPRHVRRSRSDEAVLLFYDFRAGTLVGSKWLCVVVKYVDMDAFIVTAYLTDKVKAGEEAWPGH